MGMRITHQLTVALVAVVATTACSDGRQNQLPPPPPPPQGYLPPPPMQPVPPPPAPQPPPCDPAQFLATSTAMQARAQSEAPGMKPDGGPICGVAMEGQQVVGPIIPIEQGYCYTFLGQSLPPVTQMEMELDAALPQGMTMPPPINGMLERPLLVSTTPGERTNMGEKRSCFTWPYFPVPGTARLILKARAGSGPIAGQVFRKKI